MLHKTSSASRKLAISVFALSVSACATSPNVTTSPNTLEAVTISNSETYVLRSDTTAREYQISVALPSGKAPPEGFPIIYMTDANIRFGAMVDIARAHQRGTRSAAQSAIIVGIGYPNTLNPGKERGLDLTPSLGENPTPEGFGGANDFLEFIASQLKPDIEARYAVNAKKEALFGHSFGGLFALHSLLSQPDTFDSYLVSSPSIWWGNRYIENEINNHLKSRLATSQSTPRVLVTVGELEQGQPQAPRVRNPQSPPPLPGVADRTQVDDAKRIAATLSNTFGLNSAFIEFPNETHGSVPPAAMSRSVRFFFDGMN